MCKLQLPRRCLRCLSRLVNGRDVPGCLHCGWDDYDRMNVRVSPLLGSSMSVLASMGYSRLYGRHRTARRRK